MQLRVAELADIKEVLALHYRYQIDSIDECDKKDGFITTAFTEEQLSELIEREKGLFVALKEGEIVAYVMAASWQYWSFWPLFAHMIERLSELSYLDVTLSVDNSYQYGPVCVDKSVRGEGVFEAIFEFALQQMSTRYDILVTFVNKVNPRSYQAHTRKVGLEVIQQFEFNGNHYDELVCATHSEMTAEGRKLLP